jgi:two-component system, OmpR family, KDP operon response regulator KdpE
MARLAVIVEGSHSAPRLCRDLERGGHTCRVWHLGSEDDKAIRRFAPRLMIVDCQTAHGLGARYESLCDRQNVPIFALVPEADEALVVRALRGGADGCLSKPYGLETLLAHIDACLRRYWKWSKQSKREEPLKESTGPLLDSSACVIELEGREIQLTSAECRLLERLLENRGLVVTREDLTSHVWGHRAEKNADANLSLCVYNLRSKIEPRPDQPKHLLTRWGIGYYWSDN